MKQKKSFKRKKKIPVDTGEKIKGNEIDLAICVCIYMCVHIYKYNFNTNIIKIDLVNI